MIKLKSEKGSVTVFVIITFIFCMTILVNLYWTSTNYQVTVLQAQRQIQKIYGQDVDNVDEIYNQRNDPTVVI